MFRPSTASTTHRRPCRHRRHRTALFDELLPPERDAAISRRSRDRIVTLARSRNFIAGPLLHPVFPEGPNIPGVRGLAPGGWGRAHRQPLKDQGPRAQGRKEIGAGQRHGDSLDRMAPRRTGRLAQAIGPEPQLAQDMARPVIADKVA